MAASAVAFVVSSHKSIGNFGERSDQCNSSCVIKAWGSSALVSRDGILLHHVPTRIAEVDQSTDNLGRPCVRESSVSYYLPLHVDAIKADR